MDPDKDGCLMRNLELIQPFPHMTEEYRFKYTTRTLTIFHIFWGPVPKCSYNYEYDNVTQKKINKLVFQHYYADVVYIKRCF